MSKGFVKKVTSVALGLTLAVSFTTVQSVDASMNEDERTRGGIKLTNDHISALGSKKVGGGTWSYGTKRSGWRSQYKTVWSHYWHPTKVHGASAQLGARTPDRACVGPDKTAKASQTAKTDDTGYAYWNTSCGR
ncbi:lactococcin 972 family bacteriocin [Melghirimyces algeriensis]|uniref:Bacteriocin (Lactococcin_972) n=1 Tax=Melghirimyces algeriensis TaxID=910412 RepID=A0A521BEH8_9BACL|nr:lactococcin 972 family bacteriocin [Melghirimyces algeriensis]SMO45469.1 Bacteriocin (Lactococcin_972) [Melghirimyces algeriensis]